MAACDLINTCQIHVPKLECNSMSKYVKKIEKVAIVNSFSYANFNYFPLVWHLSFCESIRKI